MDSTLAPRFSVKVGGTPLAATIQSLVTDIEVTLQVQTSDQFRFTLANPYPTMPFTHGDDADTFKEGSPVVIALGYGTSLTTLIDGEVTGISCTFPESGVPTLSVEGQSRLHRLQAAHNTRTFTESTAKDIITKLAKDAGMTVDMDGDGQKYPYFCQSGESDFDLIKKLAQLNDLDFSADGKKLVLKKSPESKSKVTTLEWGKSLMSLTPTVNTVEQVSKATVRGYDPATKKAIVGKAAASDTASAMGGSTTGPKAVAKAFSDRELIRYTDPPADQAEADNLAKALLNESAISFVTADGSCVGDPTLKAGVVVELKGLGKRFSGPYYISKATHRLGGSGYTTSFTGKKTSVS